MLTLATQVLPSINALLNALSAVLISVGYWAIRNKRQSMHRACMQAAVGTSTLFLVCYATRVALSGTHRFAGAGWAKLGYLAILFSHMTLAMACLPLVLITLFFARRGRYPQHRRIARWTFPIWMYVSVTGVLVYVILYRL